MRIVAVITAVSVFVAVPPFALEGQTTLHTTGRGEVVLPPDRAELSLSVEVRAGTAGEAGSRTEDRVVGIVARLGDLGIADDEIQRRYFAVHPFSRMEGGRRVEGYTGTARLLVRVGELSRLADILDASLDAGATGSSITVRSDSIQSGRARAIAMAFDEARRDAYALAAAAGLEVLGPVQLSTGGGVMPLQQGRAEMMTARDLTAAPNEIHVTVQLSAEWSAIRP